MRLANLRLAALALLLSVSVAGIDRVSAFGHQAAKDGPVKLFVFTKTDQSGFTDQTTKDRLDAVSDATKSLAKSKLVQIVTVREEAEVTFEVTRRVNETAKTGMGASMMKNNSWSRSPDSLKPFLYGTVTVGSGKFTTELRSADPESPGQGRNLAKVLEQWVKENQGTLRSK